MQLYAARAPESGAKWKAGPLRNDSVIAEGQRRRGRARGEYPYLEKAPSLLREKIQRKAGGIMTELMGSQEKNFFAGLVDFGFRQQQVRRLVKILYVIAMLGGFVAVVAEVVIGFQQTQSQGLTALVAGIAAFFVWVLLTRLLLELALMMVRTAEGIERATHPSN
jgi:uncharacterized protein DUF4282